MKIREMQSPLTTYCVVGGCVAVTAIAIIPFVTAQRSPARTITCVSNLKQVALATLMYSQDYDEHLPAAKNWMDTTYPYIKSKNTYRCPDLHSSKTTDFGYAYNASMALKKFTSYKTPATTIMLYDSNSLQWNASAAGRSGAANPPRHNGMDNFAFLDGHVKPQTLTGK